MLKRSLSALMVLSTMLITNQRFLFVLITLLVPPSTPQVETSTELPSPCSTVGEMDGTEISLVCLVSRTLPLMPSVHILCPLGMKERRQLWSKPLPVTPCM